MLQQLLFDRLFKDFRVTDITILKRSAAALKQALPSHTFRHNGSNVQKHLFQAGRNPFKRFKRKRFTVNVISAEELIRSFT